MENNREGGRNLGETLALYGIMLSYGVFATILGAILTRLLAEFSLPLSRGGLFQSVQNAGCFAGIFVAGVVLDRRHRRTFLLAAYAGFAALMAGMAASSGLWAFVALLFAAGLASMCIDTTLNASIARLHPDNRGMYMNLLHCFFGVGCFGGPILAGTLLESGRGWRSAYLVWGMVCFALMLAYLLAFRDGAMAREGKPVPPADGAGTRSVLNGGMFVLAAVLFLYGGHQAGVNSWFPTYLSRTHGLEALAAGAGVSTFWVGLIASRFVCSLITSRFREADLIRWGCLAGGILWGLGLALNGEWALFAGVMGAGFFAGALIPLVVTLGYSWHHDAHGKVSLMLFMALAAGLTLFPWLMGVVEGILGLRAAMFLNAILLFLAGVAAFWIPDKARSRDK